MRKSCFILIIVCTLFFLPQQYAESSNLICFLADGNGDQITTASPGDIVYLVGSYIRARSGKIKWQLTANMPSTDPKNRKMSMKYSGYYRHEGSSLVTSIFLPVLIPPFDYIEGTATFAGKLSKIGKCYGTLNITTPQNPGGGEPEGGSEDTEVKIEATAVGSYNGTFKNSVDTFQDVCTVGPPPTYEYFADHGATVTITARLINPTVTFTPVKLYIEKYTIEYKRSNDSLGAPPIETFTGYQSIIITPPMGSGTSATIANVLLVDLLRKGKYVVDVTSEQYSSGPAYINSYTAIYTFEGQNEYGTPFSFTVQLPFQMGWFDNC